MCEPALLSSNNDIEFHENSGRNKKLNTSKTINVTKRVKRKIIVVYKNVQNLSVIGICVSVLRDKEDFLWVSVQIVKNYIFIKFLLLYYTILSQGYRLVRSSL